MHHLLFIVPAFNEAANVGAVVDGLRSRFPTAEVLVVNDGSADATAAVAGAAGARVLDLPVNLGIGGAVQSGLLYADREGFEVAVQFDGDGQHLASEVEAILEPVLSGSCDVAIGSRFLGQESFRPPLMRRLGITIIARFNSLLTGFRVTDPTSGFRAFGRHAIKLLARDYPHDFPEPESIVTLARNGYRICEVPVRMKARTGGQSSITFVMSIYYMLKVLLAIGIGMTRKRVPRPEATQSVATPAATREEKP